MIQGTSIRRQMIRVIMSVSAAVIVLVSLLFAITSVTALRTMLRRTALADIGFSAEYFVTPLLFDDPQSAEQILRNYKANPSVLEAVVLDEQGELFARYAPHGDNFKISQTANTPQAQYRKGKLFLVIAIMSSNEQIGQLHVVVDNRNLYMGILTVIGTMLFMIPVIFLVAYIFAQKSQKRISKPILELSKIVGEINYRESDVNIASIPNSSYEIDILFEQFRKMMNRIKQGENELIRASQFLHTIVDSIPSLLIVVDQNNIISMCNHSAQRESVTDIVEGSLLCDSFPYMKKFNTIISKIQSGSSGKKMRAVPIKSRGLENCDMAFFPLRTEEHSGVVIIITDVTELTQKDQQLFQIQKMETVGTLAGGLAHDFNNIISGIIGTLSLMEYTDDEKIDMTELREYIAIMNHAGDRAKEMINQLLTLSHKSETTFDFVDIRQSIENVITLCQHSIDKSVEITSHFLTSSYTVHGNGAQLEQVLLNICINGAHAMTIMRPSEERQGGKLDIKVQERTLEEGELSSLTPIPAGKYLEISIADTGVGISSEMIKQIFDPFFTTKEKGKGTGLGLSMVYNIVKQHNGYLNVESTPGVGTEISIFLKLLVPSEENHNHLENTLSGIGRSGLVLIIDDEDQIRVIAKKMLNKIGFTVLQAEDGAQGIELYQKHMDSISFVLLDMVMPVLSGKDVYLQLKQINPDIKVILSSGFGQDDRVQDILKHENVNFLHKPYTIKELIEAINRSIYGSPR